MDSIDSKNLEDTGPQQQGTFNMERRLSQKKIIMDVTPGHGVNRYNNFFYDGITGSWD